MDIQKLLELNAKYRAAVAKATEDAKRAVEEIARHGASMERMALLELAMEQLDETNALRKTMAHARGKGFDAGQARRPKTDCPYEADSTESLFWYKGWCQAQNIMPFTEVPMKELFELDRVVRRFSSGFRINNLIEALAVRLFRQSGREGRWQDAHPYAQKHFHVMAAEFLRGIMDVEDDEPALDGPARTLPSATKSLPPGVPQPGKVLPGKGG